MPKTVVLGLVLAVLAACTSHKLATDQSPQSAAEAFLALIDQDNYERSWTEASDWLREKVDVNQWAEYVVNSRKPLGVVKRREFNTVEFHDSLEDMPAGSYALVFFDSSLTDNASASEMVGLMLSDDSVWRVIGYQTL